MVWTDCLCLCLVRVSMVSWRNFKLSRRASQGGEGRRAGGVSVISAWQCLFIDFTNAAHDGL